MPQEITHRAATTVQSTPFEIGAPLTSRTLFWRARYLRKSANLHHLPFLFWLIDVVRPRGFVELGLSDGVTYFAGCQALDKLDIDTRAQGIAFQEPGAGDSDRIPEDIRAYNDAQYMEFSRLSGRFEASGEAMKRAAASFADKSIDLLHVNLDLDQDMIASLNNDWTRKLSDRSVVLFSAPRTRFATGPARDFLDGIAARYPNTTLEAGDGMLVVLFGARRAERLVQLCDLKLGMSGYTEVHQVFRRLGASSYFECLVAEEQARATQADAKTREAEAALDQQKAELDTRQQTIDELRVAYDERSRQAATFQSELFDLQKEHDTMAAQDGERQTELETLRARVETLMREAELRENARKQAEQEVANLRAKAMEGEQRLREVEALRSQSNERQVALQAALQEKAGLQASLSKLQGEAEAQVGEPHGASVEELDALTARLEADRQAFEETRQELARARLALREVQADAEGVRNALTAWEARAKDAERYNKELLASTSWKVTAPVRGVLGGLRRRPSEDRSS